MKIINFQMHFYDEGFFCEFIARSLVMFNKLSRRCFTAQKIYSKIATNFYYIHFIVSSRRWSVKKTFSQSYPGGIVRILFYFLNFHLHTNFLYAV